MRAVATNEQTFTSSEDKPTKFNENLCILLLPVIIALIYLISSIYLLSATGSYADKKHDTLRSADRVLEYVYHNLKADPISDI